MVSRSTRKARLGLVLGAAVILGTGTAFAGEIRGNGVPITNHARSACVYSGLQDDPIGDAGIFKGRFNAELGAVD
jgi:hypothetical protein